VENTGIGDELNFADGMLIPDLDSFRVLPWLDSTASVLGDYKFDEIEGVENASCRMLCKKQLQKLHEMGFSLYSAFEYEFYLVDNDTLRPYRNKNINGNAPHDIARNLMYDIMRNMRKIGIKPEMYSAEYGPAQQEVTMIPYFGIEGSDNAFRFKTLSRNISSKHGKTALFVSKPFENQSGCSSHFNHSLWDLSKKTNAFSDVDKPDKLSDLCKNWIGGYLLPLPTRGDMTIELWDLG